MLAFLRPALRPADWLHAGRPDEARRVRTFLAAWLVVRTLLWVLAVVLSHHNAPLDLAEWLSWGGSWQWGYPKHPPLPAWVADAAARLSPGDVWGVYLAGYAASSLVLLAAYRLGREYLSPRPALLAALSLDGLKYLTLDPAEFSNNVMLGLGWAWLVVCFHRAIGTGRLRWWLAVGVAAGLTALCKYTVGVLILSVLAFVLWDKPSRRVLRTPGPYLAALTAMLVFLPHALWLVQNNFATLYYADERAAITPGVGKRLTQPLSFLLSQAFFLLPVAFVLRPVLRFAKNSWLGRDREICSLPLVGRVRVGVEHPRARLSYPGNLVPPPNPPHKGREQEVSPAFLHFVVWGPVLTFLAISLAKGYQLRVIWGSPLWTFAGVWALAAVGTAVEGVPTAVRRWAAVAVAVMLVTAGKQVADPYLFGVGGRTGFPGKELTREVNARWAAAYGGVPAIVGGEGWRAGVVCSYSVHRPILYSSGKMDYLIMDPTDCRWTSDADLNARGGVILWDATQLGDDLSEQLRPRFPAMAAQPAIVLPCSTGATVPPTRVGMAFVPPAAVLASGGVSPLILVL